MSTKIKKTEIGLLSVADLGGHEGCAPHLSPNRFIFMQISAKYMPNNS